MEFFKKAHLVPALVLMTVAISIFYVTAELSPGVTGLFVFAYIILAMALFIFALFHMPKNDNIDHNHADLVFKMLTCHAFFSGIALAAWVIFRSLYT